MKEEKIMEGFAPKSGRGHMAYPSCHPEALRLAQEEGLDGLTQLAHRLAAEIEVLDFRCCGGIQERGLLGTVTRMIRTGDYRRTESKTSAQHDKTVKRMMDELRPFTTEAT